MTTALNITSLDALKNQAVQIVDVSARDGLQACSQVLSATERAQWVRRLLASGIDEVEAGSFVHPGKLPQMAGTDKVLELLTEQELARSWVLVPNMRGLKGAVEAGARGVVCILSATETHSRDNLGRSISEVIKGLGQLHEEAVRLGVKARAALSMTWIDPIEGEVPTGVALELCKRVADIGFEELTLCDTYGGASPLRVMELLDKLTPHYPMDRVGLHLHDTFGTASANTLTGLVMGVRRLEGSIAGLGGCPFAPGARGNMDTAHLLHLLEGLGMKAGVDRQALADATAKCMAQLLGKGE